MLGTQSLYFFFGERCEDFDVAFGILVAYVQPELIKFVRGGVTSIQPYVARFGFPEFRSVGFGHERAGEGEYFPTVRAAYKFRSGSDITPLIGSP